MMRLFSLMVPLFLVVTAWAEQTPNIDKLAGEGMRFTRCFQAAPMCSPTRHNIYTGQYPVKSGAYPNHTHVEPGVLGGRVGSQKVELFNIASDPNESKDVAAEQPETVEELFAKLVVFRKLQPQNAVPPYNEGRKGFVAPKDWKVSAE